MYLSNIILYFIVFQNCFQWGISTLEEENEAIFHHSHNYHLPRL